MAAYYDSIKSMKSAKIGTIMPWGGDGGSGFLASNIPKGWIVCDGRNDLNAKDYPLLASIIGPQRIYKRKITPINSHNE